MADTFSREHLDEMIRMASECCGAPPFEDEDGKYYVMFVHPNTDPKLIEAAEAHPDIRLEFYRRRE